MSVARHTSEDAGEASDALVTSPDTSMPDGTIELGAPITVGLSTNPYRSNIGAGPSRPLSTHSSRRDETHATHAPQAQQDQDSNKSSDIGSGSLGVITDAQPDTTPIPPDSPAKRRRSTRSAVLPHPPPARQSSLSIGPKDSPTEPDLTHSDPEKRKSTASTAHANAPDANALLNLPPPLPFDLRVSNLWVGVPARGPSS